MATIQAVSVFVYESIASFFQQASVYWLGIVAISIVAWLVFAWRMRQKGFAERFWHDKRHKVDPANCTFAVFVVLVLNASIMRSFDQIGMDRSEKLLYMGLDATVLLACIFCTLCASVPDTSFTPVRRKKRFGDA